MRIQIDVREPAEIRAALQCLFTVNRAQLRALKRQGRRVPLLYDAGVRYRREPVGRERWQTIRETLSMRPGLRFADCEDLAAHRAAELVEMGIDPGAKLRLISFPRANGGRLYHVQVRRGDGRVEDPAKICGMPGDA